MQRQDVVSGRTVPAALFIATVANFVLSGFLIGIAPRMSWLFATGLLIAAAIGIGICCIIEFASGDVPFATWFMVFALFLVATAGETAIEFMGIPHQLMGWVFAIFSAIFIVLAITMSKVNWQLFGALIVCVLATALLAAMGLSCATPESPIACASGWLFFIFGLCLFYEASAMLIISVFGRPVLPIGGPLFK